jgi:hypothetical protein
MDSIPPIARRTYLRLKAAVGRGHALRRRLAATALPVVIALPLVAGLSGPARHRRELVPARSDR